VTNLLARVGSYGRLVQFPHSVFALPFALASAVLARRDGLRLDQVAWIVVAMVSARTAAMTFNRVVDRHLDARNPRTAARELPAGRVSLAEAVALLLGASTVFVLAAARLNRLGLYLSPVALAIVFGYSLTKRFTSLAHGALGVALAVAPVGAWLAVRGEIALLPLVLGSAVIAWVAGFDIIYACQDVDFDRRAGLHSLPARLGVARALVAARCLHGAAATALWAVYLLTPLHPLYLVGMAGASALLIYEHSLVRAEDLRRVNAAFFAVNGWVSVGYFATTLLAVLWS
jgi:4-hydroxybenzoate polyprenyltransferase